MALPIVIPAIAEGVAALSAALGLTAIATKNDQNFGNINLNGIRTAAGLNIAPLVISTGALFNKANSPVKVNVPSADNALVLRPEYRTETLVNPLEFIGYKPAWDAAVQSADSPEVVVIDDSSTMSPQPNDNPEDEDPDESWLKRFYRNRTAAKKEQAEAARQKAQSAKRRKEWEEEAYKISRRRIEADKNYQEYLRMQGRSAPRLSMWKRPISQGIPRFFGGKGPATTNRFYNSPAMGTLEWGATLGIPTGIGVGIYNRLNEEPPTSHEMTPANEIVYKRAYVDIE